MMLHQVTAALLLLVWCAALQTCRLLTDALLLLLRQQRQSCSKGREIFDLTSAVRHYSTTLKVAELVKGLCCMMNVCVFFICVFVWSSKKLKRWAMTLCNFHRTFYSQSWGQRNCFSSLCLFHFPTYGPELKVISHICCELMICKIGKDNLHIYLLLRERCFF